MPRESGASSNHRPRFYLKSLWLLDRPLSRAMTTEGHYFGPFGIGPFVLFEDWQLSSLHLDAGLAEHFAPFLGIVDNELAELGGGHRRRLGADIGKARVELGVREAGVDLAVELVDDVARNFAGRANAVPPDRLVARHEVADGWKFRQRRGAP